MGKATPTPIKSRSMLIDRHEPEDVFARIPELANQTDPILRRLDALLDDDVLYGTVHGGMRQDSESVGVESRAVGYPSLL